MASAPNLDKAGVSTKSIRSSLFAKNDGYERYPFGHICDPSGQRGALLPGRTGRSLRRRSADASGGASGSIWCATAAAGSRPPGAAAERLSEGDIALVPNGARQVLSSAEGLEAKALEGGAGRMGTGERRAPRRRRRGPDQPDLRVLPVRRSDRPSGSRSPAASHHPAGVDAGRRALGCGHTALAEARGRSRCPGDPAGSSAA